MQRLVLLLVAAALTAAAQSVSAQVPSPLDVFGWVPGADYEVADYEQMQQYFRQLADATDRAQLIEIGRSPVALDQRTIGAGSDRRR
jgi:hypothetical protein